MSDRVNKIERDSISDSDAETLICKMLKMINDKDLMFTCISNEIIESLLLEDLIEIDLENETISGTTLTEKGMIRVSKYLNM